MIKITTASGISIEMSNGEDLPAVMPLLTGVVMQYEHPSPPDSMPSADGGDPAAETDTGGMLPMMEAVEATKPKRRFIYLTEREAYAVGRLRESPDGLTSEKIAEGLGITTSNASAMMSYLSSSRPTPNTNDPLIHRGSKGIYKLTRFGMTARIKVDPRPAILNRREGWDE